MKKLIGIIETTVVDNKGTRYRPVVYDLGYGHNSIIFEATASSVACGCWGADSIATVGDKLWLDIGSGWSISGLSEIQEELKQYL